MEIRPVSGFGTKSGPYLKDSSGPDIMYDYEVTLFDVSLDDQRREKIHSAHEAYLKVLPAYYDALGKPMQNVFTLRLQLDAKTAVMLRDTKGKKQSKMFLGEGLYDLPISYVPDDRTEYDEIQILFPDQKNPNRGNAEQLLKEASAMDYQSFMGRPYKLKLGWVSGEEQEKQTAKESKFLTRKERFEEACGTGDFATLFGLLDDVSFSVSSPSEAVEKLLKTHMDADQFRIFLTKLLKNPATRDLLKIAEVLIREMQVNFFEVWIEVIPSNRLYDTYHLELLTKIASRRNWSELLLVWLRKYHDKLDSLNLSTIKAPWAEGNMCAWRILSNEKPPFTGCRPTPAGLDAAIFLSGVTDQLEAHGPVDAEAIIKFFGLSTDEALVRISLDQGLDNLFLALLRVPGAEQIWGLRSEFTFSNWLMMFKHLTPDRDTLIAMRAGRCGPLVAAVLDVLINYYDSLYRGPLCVQHKDQMTKRVFKISDIDRLIMGDLPLDLNPENMRAEDKEYFKKRNFDSDKQLVVPSAMAYFFAGFNLQQIYWFRDTDYWHGQEIIEIIAARAIGYCRSQGKLNQKLNVTTR